MKGNVVLGYETSCHLMLDYDLKTKAQAVGFTRKYAKYHDLGSALTILTSQPKQMDLSLDKDNLLNKFSAIFGKPIIWEEIQWHVKEAYELGMVDKSFLALRDYGSITIRLNAKNPDILAPKIVDYFDNGDDRGVMSFLRRWVMCRKLGR